MGLHPGQVSMIVSFDPHSRERSFQIWERVNLVILSDLVVVVETGTIYRSKE